MAGRPVRRARQTRTLARGNPPRKSLARDLTHPEIFALSRDGLILLPAMANEERAGRDLTVARTSELVRHLFGPNENDATQVATALALHRWSQNNRPIYFIDAELAKTLSNTEIPMRTFDLKIQLPDDGMFVSLPPIFNITHPGEYSVPIIGIYLVILNATLHQDIIVAIGVGKDGNAMSFGLVPGKPLDAAAASGFGGAAELTRIVCNLLYAIQNTTSIVKERVLPDPRPPSRTEKKEMERLRKVITPYTVLTPAG